MAGDTNPNRAPRQTRPENCPPEVWAVAKKVESIPLATLLLSDDLDVTSLDPDKALELLAMSQGAETAASKRYISLRQSLQPKIDAELANLKRHRVRTLTILEGMTGAGK